MAIQSLSRHFRLPLVTTMLAWPRLLLTVLAFAQPAMAEVKRYHASVQLGALAPNAGGQPAYSLKIATNDWEIGAFSNQYLMAGSWPMTGVTYAWRFPVCDDTCFWQAFLQLGGGASNAGPILETTWAAILPLLPIWLPFAAPKYYPALRLDFTTQMILIQWRGVTWSYPLWLGITFAF